MTARRAHDYWCPFVAALVVVACGTTFGHGNEVEAPESRVSEAPIVFGPPIVMTDERIGVMGRTVKGAAGLEFGYPGVTIRACFTGRALSVMGSSNNGRSRFAVVVNDARVSEFTLPSSPQEIEVWRAATDVDSGQTTCVDLVHQTETWIGIATLSSLRVAGDLVQSAPFPARKLLFVGDSVTCGEAVTRSPTCSKDPTWWNAHGSYGALAARKLGAQYHLICYGGRGVLRDWQGRSDTLNAPQFFPLAIPDERGLAADLTTYVPDVIVVSLGTNDFNLALGAFPPRERFVQTYVEFVRTLTARYPQSSVLLTEGAIVVDDADSRAKSVLRDYVQAVVAQLGASNVAYLPSKHQAGDVCDSHPTDAQHVEMAAEVSEAITTKLGW